MSGPILGLILGIFLLFYTFLAYTDSFLLKKIPVKLYIQGNKWYALGLILISFAFMFGIIGYFMEFSGQYLRILRFLLLVSGLIIVKETLKNNLEAQENLPQFAPYLIQAEINGLTLLKICGFLVLLLLFIKSIVAVDWRSGDTWIYQLPFAARIWGLVTKEEYILPYDREILYGHTTMLGNFLQGFFWYLFGVKNPQGANLVSFFSLIIFFIFLRSYLKIPIYLASLSILAVPLIHIAATACYVDLLGNIGVSIAIIMTYLLYVKNDFLNRKNIIVFTLASATAANTKYLMVPPILIILFFALGRIIWLYYPQWKQQTSPNKLKQISWFLSLTLLISLVIFATESKNLILHGNPFYPMKIEIAGITLNHIAEPSSDYMSDKIKAMFPLQRWIFSLLEIGAFNEQRPLLWTIAMDYVPLNDDTFGMGGYFSLYVIFNLLLFIALCTPWVKETKIALILFLIMSLITAFLPFSYQLRYYMYWILTLISLNLYLVSEQESFAQKLRFINLKNVGYGALVFLIAFGVITNWEYTYPNRMSLAKFMTDSKRIDPELISQIQDNDKVCIVTSYPLVFLYNSKFNPGKNYSLKYEFAISDEYAKEKCQDYRIIKYER